nr:immunoglobulin heavy chain junction region [Mus musculus]
CAREGNRWLRTWFAYW